jgi:hypothetical protein
MNDDVSIAMAEESFRQVRIGGFERNNKMVIVVLVDAAETKGDAESTINAV